MDNYTPTSPYAAYQQPEQPHSRTPRGGWAAKIAIVIIVMALIILGGLYFYGARRASQSAVLDTAEETPADAISPDADVVTLPSDQALDQVLQEVKDPTADKLRQQSTSDDLQSIENDLNNSDLGEVNVDDLGF